MSRPFAVFDIDGTLIRWQLYHAIADALAHLGYFNPDQFKQIREARMNWKRRANNQSFEDYESQLVASYENMLGQLTVEQFEEAVDLAFDEYKDQVYAYTRDLVNSLKAKDYLLFAISNSQIEIVQKIANHFGFDDCIGAIYHRKGNKFTGQKTVYLTDKDKVLKDLVVKHKATWQNSIAVGDSASDIPMLEIVERPIAFNPEKKLLDIAKSKNWQIVVERKNVTFELKAINGKYILA